MPVLVNKPQGIRTGVMYPRGVYSRQVLVELKVPAGVGNNDYAVTPPVGIETWLMGVDLWLFPTASGGWIGGLIHVSTGTGKEVNAGIIATQWDPLMDMTMMFKRSMLWYGEREHLHFAMQKYLGGSGRRFGVTVENLTALEFWCIGAFEISEG